LKHHLPISLLLLILLGAAWPEPGQWLSQLPITSIAICLIFFLQGLKLETEEAKDALRSVRAIVYGFSFILFLSPFLAFALRLFPLEPADLTVGLCLFLTMPATISTGVIFTREAHGNGSLALLLCVGTTLLSIPIMPLTIPFFALSGDAAGFDTANFLLNLCLTILLPLAVGKGAKELLPTVNTLVQRHSNFMKYVSSAALLLLPFIQVSRSHDEIAALSFGSLLLTLIEGSVAHVVLLAANVVVCRYGSSLLHLDEGKRRAIIMCCSEKTLAIAVAVLPLMSYSEERKGVLAVAIVIAHLTQIVMDGLLASWWRSRTEDEWKRKAAETTGTAQAGSGGDTVSIAMTERKAGKEGQQAAPAEHKENGHMGLLIKHAVASDAAVEMEDQKERAIPLP
jgi:predicted Na+-dependent transporter